jgi:hypothetical protein
MGQSGPAPEGATPLGPDYAAVPCCRCAMGAVVLPWRRHDGSAVNRATRAAATPVSYSGPAPAHAAAMRKSPAARGSVAQPVTRPCHQALARTTPAPTTGAPPASPTAPGIATPVPPTAPCRYALVRYATACPLADGSSAATRDSRARTSDSRPPRSARTRPRPASLRLRPGSAPRHAARDRDTRVPAAARVPARVPGRPPSRTAAPAVS